MRARRSRHRPERLVAVVVASLVLAGLLARFVLAPVAALATSPPSLRTASQRIVSLNPSLTAILVALGARDQLVGVDDFSSKSQPEVAALPRVGGLFSPSLEAVVALEPDLVVLVPGAEQRAFQLRIEALGIATRAFANIDFAEVLENITGLGQLAGRASEAQVRVAEILRTRAEIETAVAGRPSQRVLLVLQRDPLYVVGGGSFIDEMLRAAGAENIAAEFDEAYPQIAVEWVVAQQPGVILDMSADPPGAIPFWSRWPTLPAVQAGRVEVVDPDLVTLPGPALDRSLRVLAAALHGESFATQGASAPH